MAYLRVSLSISTILMGLILALLTITFNGLLVSLFCIVCWAVWACVGSLNFSRIRSDYVLARSRQFYEGKVEHLSRYQKLAVTFPPEGLTPHLYNEKLLSGEQSFNVDDVMRHLQFILFNAAQAIYLNLRNRFFASSEDSTAGVLDLRLMATISSYHTIVEYLLVMSRSDDNRREAFDNRIETLIVHLQLIVCLVKQYSESKSSDEPSVLLSYALNEAFSTVYRNLRGLLRNSSGRSLDQLVSFVVFPLCQWAQPPLDKLRLSAASEIRDNGIFPSDFFDKHSSNFALDDRNLTVYLTFLLEPSFQAVFDAFQKDLRLELSSGDSGG